MKTIVKYVLAAAMMAAALLSLEACNLCLNEKILRGEGEIISKTIPAPEFTAIEAHRMANVKLVEKPQGQITVSTHANVMPYAVVTCTNGVLRITIDPAINSANDIDLNVIVPSHSGIEYLSASSAGRIETNELKVDHTLRLKSSSAASIEGTIKAPAIEINASSAAQVEATVETEELQANASSAARIRLQGAARSIRARASSTAKIDAEKLLAEEGDIEASSAARADVSCSKFLKAESSSAGSIKNHQKPERFESSQSSAGSVESGANLTE